MTPRQKYGHDIPEYIPIHELGHAIIGYSFGISPQSIFFCAPETGELAQSWYSSTGSSPLHQLIRTLGGSYAQADITPESLEPHLTKDILSGKLFTNHLRIESADETPIRIKNAGLQGDWIIAISQARAIESEPSKLHETIENAYSLLVESYQANNLREGILATAKDFNLWLETENDDLHFTDSVYYPTDRLLNMINNLGIASP